MTKKFIRRVERFVRKLETRTDPNALVDLQHALQRENSFFPYASLAVYHMWQDPCVYCGGQATSWDHLDARTVNGYKQNHNRARACRLCNSRKGSGSLLHYLVWRRRNPNKTMYDPVRHRHHLLVKVGRLLVRRLYEQFSELTASSLGSRTPVARHEIKTREHALLTPRVSTPRKG